MHPVDAAIHPQLQQIGALHYFDPLAKAAGEALGLDLFRLYIAGRAGVMGEVIAPVVHAAFGYFEPGVIAKMWNSSRERCSATDAAQAHLDVAFQIGRARIADIDGLADTATALRAVSQAVDSSGLPLFAGYQALAPASEPVDAFMQEAIVMRELRGSVHLAAVAGSGCSPVVAHAIRRPNDVEMFGWKNAPTITDDDRARLALADEHTDYAMAKWFEALPNGTDELVIETVAAAHQRFFDDNA